MTLLRVEYFRGPYRVSKASDEVEVTAGVLWVLATAWIRGNLDQNLGKRIYCKEANYIEGQ
jgi:hypothetical protein